MTKYMVLQLGTFDPIPEPAGPLDKSVPAWEEVGVVEAVNDAAAIKLVLGGREQAGTFVAVPVRSWSPRKVEVVATVVVRMEDAAKAAIPV